MFYYWVWMLSRQIHLVMASTPLFEGEELLPSMGINLVTTMHIHMVCSDNASYIPDIASSHVTINQSDVQIQPCQCALNRLVHT